MDPLTLALGLGKIGLGIFGGLSQSKQAEQQRKLSREQLAQQERESQKQYGLLSTQADPLAQQRSRQQQSLMEALLSGARPTRLEVPEQYRQYMPKRTGGFSIPEGGFSAETLAPYGAPARQAAEQQFFGQMTALSPYVRTPVWSQVGYPQAQEDPARQVARDLYNTGGLRDLIRDQLGRRQVGRGGFQ